jgi:TolB-like protein/tetratricopeptide (TPR) repeat protein/predicted Ser/Thr protein kinase
MTSEENRREPPAGGASPAETKVDPQLSACAQEGGSPEALIAEGMSSQPARLAVGQLLGGRYRIERELGEGGMGVVYLARDEQVPSEQFAIKVLKEDLRPETLALLREEVRKTRKLSHPNIVDVHSVNVDGSKLYVLMEYLEGKSLDALLNEEFGRGMSLSHALPIIEDVSAALGNAHDHNVIHSDLKPANVFVTTSGRTKLLDFGIARVSRGPLLKAGSGHRALTPAYASCEMLEGKEADRRDDVYSFACVIYETLCGERPFGELTALEARAAGTRLPPLQGLSREQNEALAKALAFERKARTGSVEQLLAGLVADRRPRGRHGVRRWAVSVGAALLVAAGALVWWRGQVHQVAPPSIAVLPFVDLTVGKTEQPFCDGVTEEISNWLAQIPLLRVVARSSAFAFRDRQADVREIGRQLGTTHVLEGSLRRAGNVMRVSVQLISTRDGYNVWSGSYDAAASNVIQVQEEVARAVANNLELPLTEVTVVSLNERRSSSAQAYATYLVARHHQQQRTKQDNERAIELYREAIHLDPDFALAQVGLAYAYLNQRYFNDRPIADIAHDATPLLERAAQRAPRLADLYVVRGALETELVQHDAALRDLHQAEALNPNSREAASELGFYYLVNGQPRDALRYYSHAAVLDPLDYNLAAQRCTALADLGEYDGATAACGRSRNLNPHAVWAYSVSSDLEEARGRLVEALRWNSAALERSADTQELYSQRGQQLLSLGLPERAGECYATAVMATGTANANPHLSWVGLVTAYAGGGLQALHERIESQHLADTSDPNLLFQLASAELLAGEPQAARAFADRALASPDLRPDDLASPWLARTGNAYLVIAAAAHQATGDPVGAEQHLSVLSGLLDRLTAAGMRRHGVYVLQAQVAALRGDGDGAMRALQRAADQGWREVWLAEREPYFTTLRPRADFRALLERLRADNEANVRALAPEAPTTPAPKS